MIITATPARSKFAAAAAQIPALLLKLPAALLTADRLDINNSAWAVWKIRRQPK